MKIKKLMLVSVLVFLGSTVFSQTDERGPWYIDIGIGLGGIVNNNLFKGINPAASLDASIGVPGLVKSLPDLYFVGSFTLLQDFVPADFGNVKAKNTSTSFMIAPGIRYYPLPSMKYLQLGADVGYSMMWLRTITSAVVKSDPGLGLKASAAFDFNSTLTGWSLMVGTEVMTFFIPSNTIIGLTCFARAVFK